MAPLDKKIFSLKIIHIYDLEETLKELMDFIDKENIDWDCHLDKECYVLRNKIKELFGSLADDTRPDVEQTKKAKQKLREDIDLTNMKALHDSVSRETYKYLVSKGRKKIFERIEKEIDDIFSKWDLKCWQIRPSELKEELKKKLLGGEDE